MTSCSSTPGMAASVSCPRPRRVRTDAQQEQQEHACVAGSPRTTALHLSSHAESTMNLSLHRTPSIGWTSGTSDPTLDVIV